MVRKVGTPLLYTSILYFCGFFLFLEWLNPMREITDISNVTVFILFTLFCFFISLLQVTWWLSFLIKGTGLLIIINGLFFIDPFLSKVWFSKLYTLLTFDSQALFAQQWYELTDLFRSMLLLFIIWLMSYLIHYWFVAMKRIFLFVLMTFIYLTILDTFTVYDADISIVRTFIISFTALGMANFSKEIDSEKIRFSWVKKLPAWMFPLVAIVLFSSLVGYAAPKFDPQWPDPVPFIKSTAENAGESGRSASIKKVGYGEDDSQLGGSFVQDYTPVFQAAVNDKHYWRIETKDLYTGKGWEKSTPPNYVAQENGQISMQTFSENVETEQLEAIVDFQGNVTIDKLIYPYGIEHVKSVAGAQFLLDTNSGTVQTQINNTNTSLEKYTITYQNPSFSVEALQAASGTDPSIQEKYTSLPPELPSRIGELAKEITAAQNSRYEKARAIEQYFNQNGFVYQISNVPVPEADQDYVDQFLFDSKVGYCDNYSTSMVVMLRTLDIPARWAKGFTGGEKIGSMEEAEDSFDVYEVTNANAHSWVEVYFQGIGWVPFEPTQGFDNLSEFHTESPTETEITIDDLEEEEQQAPLTEDEEPEVENDSESKIFQMNWLYVAVVVVLFLLISFIFYKTRLHWKGKLLSKKLTKNKDARTFEQAYRHLLTVLRHKYFAKKPDQTLREYAKLVDRKYGTNEMEQLTRFYERMLYSNEVKDIKKSELTEQWKIMMKRIMDE